MLSAFHPLSLQFGEMVEWSITTVLKTVVPRGTGGSNPSLSALHFFRLSEDYAENIANRRNSNELRHFFFVLPSSRNL